MAEPAWSLLTTAEALDGLRLDGSVGDITTQLEGRYLAQVTEIVEEIVGYQIIERAATVIEELHDLQVVQGFLQLRRRPIIAFSKLFIPADGSEVDTDQYTIDTIEARVMLKGTSGSGRAGPPPSRWDGPGFVDFPEDYYARFGGGAFPALVAAAKVEYRGGFENTASVPGGLKRAALDILARWYRDEERKSQGKSSEVAQGFTFVSKFSDQIVSEEVRKMLRRYSNLSKTAREVVQPNP